MIEGFWETIAYQVNGKWYVVAVWTEVEALGLMHPHVVP
jgi:hypothetical protein